MSRMKAPELRRGNANTKAVVELEAKPGPDSVELFTVPPAPGYVVEKGGEALWAEVWLAGGSFYMVETDYHSIERYVTLLLRREFFLRTLDVEGYTAKGSAGQSVAHPMAKMLEAAEASILRLEKELGRTPEARIRLGLGRMKIKTALDDFLEG